ncbi:MAG TPA: hypothetical protein VF551_01250, partial [Chthoniobacterales bacterium]
ALNAASWNRSLDMAAIGNGRLSLGASREVAYTASSLGAGADGVYRLGSGSYHRNAPPKLVFSGTDNLFTGARSVELNGTYAYPFVGDVSHSTTIVLHNPNDYTGGTTLSGGTLTIGHNGALGLGALRFRNGTLSTIGGPRTITNQIVFDGPTTAFCYFGGTDPLTITKPLDLNGQRRFLINENAHSVTLAGAVTNGTLAATYGTWFLSGPNAGQLEINDYAQVYVADDTALGAPGATLRVYNGILRPQASFTSSRRLDFGSTSNARILTAGHTLTLTGSTAGTFEKGEAGTLILRGAGPFSSLMNVSGGTLLLETSGAKSATVAVSADGTVRGSGAIALHGIDAAAGGTVSPGNPIGSFSCTSGWTSLQPGSLLKIAIGGRDRGTGYSHLDAGDAMLGGDLEVRLVNDFVPQPGDSFAIFTANAAPWPHTFGAWSFPRLPHRQTFRLNYSATAVTLSVGTIGSYDEWTHSHFSIAQQRNAALSARTADLDGDGLSNFAEYFSGSDPADNGSRPLLEIGTAREGEASYATLTFPMATGMSDVSYKVETADALTSAWTEASFVEIARLPANGIDTVTVKMLVATDGAKTRFYRLKLASL